MVTTYFIRIPKKAAVATMCQSKKNETANDSGEGKEVDLLGALIYREDQPRKVETAAAAQRKNTSIASAIPIPPLNDSKEPSTTPNGNSEDSKKRKRDLYLKDDHLNIDAGKKKQKFINIDLTDVPEQPPILKGGHLYSKYKGVTFNKLKNKWVTRIIIAGKRYLIGYYENEEEAAVDYARAVFNYRSGNDEVERCEGRKCIDLAGVPHQLPIFRDDGCRSKYEGVTFNKQMNKWRAKIHIDGKYRHIGYYDNEEEAAVDYARAVSKYRGEKKEAAAAATQGKKTSMASTILLDDDEKSPNKPNAREEVTKKKKKIIDLSDVPKQLPILKSSGKGGSSKYLGVTLDMISSRKRKWKAQITIEGKVHRIGSYEDEKDAAVDFARAVFKYRGGKFEVESQEG